MTITATDIPRTPTGQLDAWLDRLAMDGKAANTLDAYRRDLMHLLGYLKARGVASFTAATTADLVAYFDDEGLAKATRYRRYSSLLGFYVFLVLEGAIATNVFAEVPRPQFAGRGEALEGDVPAASDIRRIVERAPEGSRDRAILELVAAGLTPTEVQGLGLRDLDLEGGRVMVVGRANGRRTNARRPIDLPTQAWTALRLYLQGDRETWRKSVSASTRAVFFNAQGRPADRQLVWRIVRDHAVGAGVPDITPHCIRRARIASLLREGHDVAAVARVAGHADTGLTERYRHLAERQASA